MPETEGPEDRSDMEAPDPNTPWPPETPAWLVEAYEELRATLEAEDPTPAEALRICVQWVGHFILPKVAA